ncbi:hypothetical protein [Streptomyces sp. NPDC015131]|uniref:hypothetical protein n=1 Tax=Streptomyces sp. NPDC015131 TaxID=3364941 RepID=UPI003701F508
MALPTTAALLAGLGAGLPATGVQAAEKPAPDAPRNPHIASCRTDIEGSRVTAFCHNPYPGVDRVRLHVECARWWDIDTDSAPVEVGPTAYVELTQRCWKEVGNAWISHQPEPARP